jgi:predicted anti-sigma-YlaC factor YlaD
MLTPIPSSECVRAREAASAQVDGELSELEAAQLAAHRRVCAECDEFAAELRGLATVLRLAPLEPAPRRVLVAEAPRPARALPLRAAAVAAVAAAAASFVLGQGLLQGDRSSGRAAVSAPGRPSVLSQTPARHARPVSAHFFALMPVVTAPPPMTRTGAKVAI